MYLLKLAFYTFITTTSILDQRLLSYEHLVTSKESVNMHENRIFTDNGIRVSDGKEDMDLY